MKGKKKVILMYILIKDNQGNIFLEETCDAIVGMNFWLVDTESEMTNTMSQTFSTCSRDLDEMEKVQLKVTLLQSVLQNVLETHLPEPERTKAKELYNLLTQHTEIIEHEEPNYDN